MKKCADFPSIFRTRGGPCQECAQASSLGSYFQARRSEYHRYFPTTHWRFFNPFQGKIEFCSRLRHLPSISSCLLIDCHFRSLTDHALCLLGLSFKDTLLFMTLLSSCSNMLVWMHPRRPISGPKRLLFVKASIVILKCDTDDFSSIVQPSTRHFRLSLKEHLRHGLQHWPKIPKWMLVSLPWRWFWSFWW